jgi:hypothetical protein
MMFRLSSISGAALAGVCAASVFATTVTAQNAATDIGTLDKEAAEKAFPFGLLHGFGFAGALAEVGLPHHAIPIALLFFNLGVELDSWPSWPRC